eukprot:GFUD01009029.1.p1 GENE.GFUD01009029.1~~GFUD01009029.1.p1  ORF type:complete len:448 (-),score=110.48 GFUD01009029.1:124-1467(-)
MIIRELCDRAESLRSIMLFRELLIMNQIQKSVKFLAAYSWIYDFKVTNILSDNILETIPIDWFEFLKKLTTEDFNDIFINQEVTTNLPSNVKNFIETYNLLKNPVKKCSLSNSSLSFKQKRGINLKKEHEIINFANFIDQKGLASDVTNIVDIGSGLGYLGEELTRKGYKVIGIEGSEGHSERAENRKKQNESHNFDTFHLKIDEGPECLQKLSSLVPDKTCLVGLHCCGDLTPQLLRIFTKINGFSNLMLVSCCYHKMSPSKDGLENFPLSAKLKEAVKSVEDPGVFGGFMLRLGAQETVRRWSAMGPAEHEKHKNNVGFRAVLEKVAKDNDIELKKKKRKGVLQSDFDNIDAFKDSLPKRYNIDENKLDLFNEKISECYDENSEHFDLFEIITGLQFLLQSVIENLIHMDRILYLEQLRDFSECEIVEIFDDTISPRNKVIYAKK